MCFPEVCNADELNDLMFKTLSHGNIFPTEKNFVDNGTFLVDLSCPALDDSWSTTDIIGLYVVFVYRIFLFTFLTFISHFVFYT